MSKYGYREIRKMGSDSLRALCIKENWYTRGNNEEYAKLLDMADRENITTDDIVEIATEIIDKSDMDFALCPLGAIYTNVMYKLGKICCTFFEEC